MIYQKDLDEAIAECLGKRNPDAQTCIKLAAFYTIKQQLYGKDKDKEEQASWLPVSYSNGPDSNTVSYESETAFGQAVYAKEENRVWPLIDEFVETVRIINPRLYEAFMRNLTHT